MCTESRQKRVLSTAAANYNGLARAQFVPVCGQRETLCSSLKYFGFPATHFSSQTLNR
jgi:hypothetical protein